MVGTPKGRAAGKVRLHVPHPLAEGQEAPLTREQAHYLATVMRLGPGALVTAFDGHGGAWAARIVDAGRKGGRILPFERTAPQRDPPDLWLLFAPLKKARTDFVVEKAVELGARRIVPVQTEHTNAERLRRDRLLAHAVEAAEQCGGTFVPEVAELAPLARVLDAWPPERGLAFADEALSEDADWADGSTERPPAAAALPPPPAALLVGPEGGFSAAERARIRAMPQSVPLSLGPRILRADTAAVAALALWQSARGDWNSR
jgi:16S rRNA (uracil1498-N3)-methyltransferase